MGEERKGGREIGWHVTASHDTARHARTDLFLARVRAKSMGEVEAILLCALGNARTDGLGRHAARGVHLDGFGLGVHLGAKTRSNTAHHADGSFERLQLVQQAPSAPALHPKVFHRLVALRLNCSRRFVELFSQLAHFLGSLVYILGGLIGIACRVWCVRACVRAWVRGCMCAWLLLLQANSCWLSNTGSE